MTKLKLVTYPDPILDKKTEDVTEFDDKLRSLVSDMIITMHAEKGVGLAGPQVGVSKSLFVFADGQNPEGCIINPKVVNSSEDTVESNEGCLSFPSLSAVVPRKTWVEVSGRNVDGSAVTLRAEGLQAIIFQHEMDHLNGVTFLSYLSKLKRDIMKKKMEKFNNLKPKFFEEVMARHYAKK